MTYPQKSFGQNLLTDKNYLYKIISSVDLESTDTVLEIGSGSGLLTTLLAKKVKKVFAVEIEKKILIDLERNLEVNKIKNVEIIKSSFLKININSLINKPFKVVGNIPYNITSKILLKLFGEIDKPAPHLGLLKEIYLMLQLEVAKRLVAVKSTKEYSPLTLLVQYFSHPKILFKVPRGAFYPPPKVDSAFVGFKIKESLPFVKNKTVLKNIIRVGFQQRRKKIVNSLAKIVEDKKALITALNKSELKPDLRVENLSIEDYITLSNELC